MSAQNQNPERQSREQQPQDLFAPIPEVPSVAGWKEIPFRQTELTTEPLVPLGMFTENRQIFASSVYDDEHENSPYDGGLEGGLTALFVRQGVAERMKNAASMLPKGVHMVAMDTYRPLVVQGALFDQYKKGLKEKYPDWTEDQLNTETQKYVSVPSSDQSKPSPHNTGGSVDVVLVRFPDDANAAIEEIDRRISLLDEEKDWQQLYELEMDRNRIFREQAQMLEFGTHFDHGNVEASLRYLEEQGQLRELTEQEKEAQANRRLLYNVMIAAGFEPYADEWWHFNDPATQMGAKTAGREFAEYGGVELSLDNQNFDAMRRLHRINTARIANGERWTPPAGLEGHYDLAVRLSHRSNPKHLGRAASLKVAKIEP